MRRPPPHRANLVLSRRDGQGWVLHDGEPDDPTVRLRLSVEDAAALCSRGLTPEGAARVLAVEGDRDLGGLVAAGLATFFGRDSG